MQPIVLLQACEQIGQALSIPSTAVLAGLPLVVGFAMSHSVVEVEGTDWQEPFFTVALNSNANRDRKIPSLQVFEAVGEASS